MNAVEHYNTEFEGEYLLIAQQLYEVISSVLGQDEMKIWHAHPVWFINGNPIVGYSKQKKGMRLMFWSGADFPTPGLAVRGAKFKDASVFYNFSGEIKIEELQKWLEDAEKIQWDYKNLIQRKGKLEKIEL